MAVTRPHVRLGAELQKSSVHTHLIPGSPKTLALGSHVQISLTQRSERSHSLFTKKRMKREYYIKVNIRCEFLLWLLIIVRIGRHGKNYENTCQSESM